MSNKCAKYRNVTVMLDGMISQAGLALLKVHTGTENITWNSTNNKGAGGTEDKQRREKFKRSFWFYEEQKREHLGDEWLDS